MGLDKKTNVVMLGLDNAGKTSILRAGTDEVISHALPSQGHSVRNMVHNGYRLSVWDVGGQKTLRPHWTEYSECSDALVYVVDSSDAIRLEESRAGLQALLHEDKLAGVPLLVY